jgi:hypothetical protein
VKRVALWHFQVNLRLHRFLRRARGERPWRLGGGCERCARCCEAPAVAVGPLTWSFRPARRAFLWWQRQVNGFELVRADAEDQAFVFRCTHFDPGTRACDSYGSRPGMCRDYPRHLLWAANPELLPGCGYRARPPNADALGRTIYGLELTDEQRARLRSGLRLDG